MVTLDYSPMQLLKKLDKYFGVVRGYQFVHISFGTINWGLKSFAISWGTLMGIPQCPSAHTVKMHFGLECA